MSKRTKEELLEIASKSKQFHDVLYSTPINENIIIEILSDTTNEDRQIIRGFYKKLYLHPIQDDINLKLKNKLREISIDMFDSPYEYDARELHKALNALNIDDSTIIEIFVTRPKNHLEVVDVAYQKFFKVSLRDEIQKKFSEECAQFLEAILDGDRPVDQTISGEGAYAIAKELIKNGLKDYGKDVNLFRKIFVEKSREDLILISRAYNELSGKCLYDVIKSEISGKNQKILKNLLFAVITPAQWFAKKCKKCIREREDYRKLLRILIFRAEIDMYAIRDYYSMENNDEISNGIGNCYEGAFGQILINLSMK